MKIDAATKRWVRNASDEAAAANGCTFDEERGQIVIDFAEKCLRLYEGDQAGELLTAMPWQIDAIMRMFGWVRPSTRWKRLVRRFTKASIWVPKKNGKSPTLAWLGLYLLCADGEMGQKVYLAAKDGTQSREIAGKHAIEMVLASDQLMAECTINKSLMQITHEPTRSIMKPISSADAKSQKSKEGLNGSILVDECFVAGTMIDTPHGGIPIDKVTPGQVVCNALGRGIVVATIKREASHLCRLEYSDGTKILCTSSHPVFTGRGWIEAEQLAVGEIAFRRQDVQALWNDISSAPLEEQDREDLCADREVMGRTGILLNILREEGEESDVQGGGSQEIIGDAEADRTQADDTWRKREAAVQGTRHTACGAGGWLETGIADTDWRPTEESDTPDLLQGGYWKLNEKDRHRGGRPISRLAIISEARRQENDAFGQPRLVRVSHIECESPVAVYNLHISGHPSYFANELLVHNCHVVDRAFMSRISRAGISRSEPFQIEVSTAGDDPESYGKERYDWGKLVEAGEKPDERLFFSSYEVPASLSIEELQADPLKYGKMANPAWGLTVDPVEFLDDFTRSQASLRDFAEFRMYRLNNWMSSSSPAIKPEDWNACYQNFEVNELRGRECYAGLDLGFKWDTSSLQLWFPWDVQQQDQEEYERAMEAAYKDDLLPQPEIKKRFRLLSFFWLPEYAVEKERTKVNWHQWAKDGYLTVTEGNTADFPLIKREIAAIAKMYDIVQLNYDERFAQILCQQLQDESHINVHPFAQTAPNYNEPCLAFEQTIIDGRVAHLGNKVMGWQIGNVTFKERGNAVLPDKPENNRLARIDGPVAAIMGLDAAMRSEGKSIYSRAGELAL